MPKIDESELQKIITGRVVPHIYTFATNTLPNFLKVGDTYRPVEERLYEWRRYYSDLEEISRHKAMIDDEVFFRDYAVHKYLQQKGITQIPIDTSKGIYSSEFFEGANKIDVAEAVDDIIENYQQTNKYEYYNNSRELVEYHYSRTEDFKPRENQKKVIDNFGAAIKKGRTNLLMYAVMRFGKSITSIWSAKSINSKLTVIVSAKADVRSEWKQTVESHKDFIGYRFIDSTDLKKGLKLPDLYGQKFKTGSGDEETCTNLVLFFTLQDLAGSTETIKKHHEILQTAQVDLLIVDETHFGARAQVLGKILAGVEIDDEDKNSLKNDKEDPENLGSLNKLEAINAKIKLHLSGTPYRILMGSEFEQDDVIAFVQFSDIYEAKLNWNAEHLEKDEWENPYYGFPRMIRFAFNPNESSRKKLAEIPGSKPAELFTPVSVHKNSDYETFKHEQEVIDLLLVLDGSKSDTNMLGLLNNETVKAGKLASHIVVVLPFRASCDALEKLIKDNNTLFKNISEYEIFNISGHNKTLSTPEEIKAAIIKAELADKKTITLTVNKMLTGTTVPQWDTMIYLKSTASPQEYDQAIFRLQSPWVKKYQDKNGNVIKYDMKPQTLLVDFDPTRLFYLQEMKAFTYGANTQNVGNENIEEFIKRELKISPIITLNAEGNKLIEVTATTIIDEVRKYANDRTITEDVKEVGIDLSLKDIPAIYEVISKLTELGDKGGLSIKPNQEEGEELDGAESIDGMGATNDEPSTPSKNTSNTEEFEDASSFEKRCRTYYVMILLFAFLSLTEEKSLTDVINNLDANDDNRRIAHNLGLNKDVLILVRDNMNPFVRNSLDYKIQNSDFRSYDDSISPIDHINITINKFGRLSEAEVFTPSTIVDKMYDAFDKEFWQHAKNSKVLDIASKSGSFANGFVKTATQNGASLKNIKDNFYSIPTSPAAYEFTRKMYEALGLNVDNIARHFNSFNLVKLNDDQVNYLLSQDKKFCDITLNDLENYVKIAENSHVIMKFTAVVGNPPYQVNTNTNFAVPVYHLFFNATKSLAPDYISLIHPARFLFNAGATPKEWNKRMLNDPHLSVLLYEPDSQKIFSGVDIKGGICITFWDKKMTNSGLGGQFIANEELRTILEKVKVGGFDKIVGSRGGTRAKRWPDSYGRYRSYLPSSVFTNNPENFVDTPDSAHRVKIIGLINNRRTIRFISERLLDDPTLNKWKVFIPKSNGTGAFGEALSSPLIGEPSTGCTESFIQIGIFDNESAAQSCIKYIKTKFCRTMLGTLKITQDNSRNVWKNVPLFDFNDNSDIDWSKSVSDIDKQLYVKFKLSENEKDFIETHVKAME